MKLMKHYKVEYDLTEFVFNKYYREEMMKNVDTNNVTSTKITKEKKVDDDKLDYDLPLNLMMKKNMIKKKF
jgi:hypothetical protein